MFDKEPMIYSFEADESTTRQFLAWAEAQDREEFMKIMRGEKGIVLQGGGYEVELVPKPKWIPVSERFPEKNGYYLVCDEDGYIYTLYFMQEVGPLCFYSDSVAWMPVPDPYYTSEEL